MIFYDSFYDSSLIFSYPFSNLFIYSISPFIIFLSICLYLSFYEISFNLYFYFCSNYYFYFYCVLPFFCFFFFINFILSNFLYLLKIQIFFIKINEILVLFKFQINLLKSKSTNFNSLFKILNLYFQQIIIIV